MSTVLKTIALTILLVIIYVQYMRGKASKATSNSSTAAKLKAFQSVIEYSEHQRFSNENYYTHFGGSKTYDLQAGHPNKLISIGAFKSTAFGRFQYIYSTWVSLALKYGANDMLPETQDRINANHLVELGISGLLDNNDFEGAIDKASRVWASLPGASQNKVGLDQLRSIYTSYLSA